MSLSVVPLTLAAANRYVTEWHRHHGAFPAGLDYFRIGVISEDGAIHGAAIVSRPPNRNANYPLTV